MKSYVILGYTGTLGNRIFDKLINYDAKVIGISTKNLEVRKFNLIEKINFNEDALFKEFDSGDEVVLICCVRESDKFHSESYFQFLRNLTARCNLILNFNTYINYQTYEFEHKHSIYMQNQERQSVCLSESAKKLGVRDVEICLYTLYGLGDSPRSFINSLVFNVRNNMDYPSTKLEQYVSYTFLEDVLLMIMQVLNNSEKYSGSFKFWAEPPLKLKEFAFQILETFQSDIKLILGHHSYNGHELMEYSSKNFPPSIDPDFNWTPFVYGLKKTFNI